MAKILEFTSRPQEPGLSPEGERLLAALADALQRSTEPPQRDDKAALPVFALDEFAARVEYEAALQQPTPNADGIHVGDIYWDSYGYDMTIVTFWQVAALKGKHTAVIREIASRVVEGDGLEGRCSPIRDAFLDREKPREVRTRPADEYSATAWIGSPENRGRRMSPASEFESYHFNTLD